MGWLTKFLKGGNYCLPGLDIGSYSLKLVQLEKNNNYYKPIIKSEYVYEDQIFAGTEVIDLFLLSSYIREVFKSNGIKEKEVAIHVPLTSCFYSVISVPVSRSPEEAVMNYMQSIITPEELAEVKIDYRVLPVSIDKKKIDIAVAAVKRDFLEERIGVIIHAGLNPVVIDIEPAAINNQFYLNYPESITYPACLVDIGATFTKIVISFGGYPYLTRNVEYGGHSITEQLQKEFILGVEDAEELKRGNSVKDVTYEEAFNRVITASIKKIVTEILWTIENFRDRFNLDVDKIYLYGGSSKLKGIVEVVRELTGKEVYKGAPLSLSSIKDSEEFGVAVGLSLRYKGDSNAKV
jgi:type IV pilus assembly protein PilM